MQKEARLAKLKAELDSRGGLPDIPSDILAYFLQRFSPAWLARSVRPSARTGAALRVQRSMARTRQHGVWAHFLQWRFSQAPRRRCLFVCLFVCFSFPTPFCPNTVTPCSSDTKNGNLFKYEQN